jgi:hypothetical protein
MNIYLISQSSNTGYDTYDSAVVIAEDEYAARTTHPSDYYKWVNNECYFIYRDGRIEKDTDSAWVSNPFLIDVEFIGTAPEGSLPRVVCSSFNAG